MTDKQLINSQPAICVRPQSMAGMQLKILIYMTKGESNLWIG